MTAATVTSGRTTDGSAPGWQTQLSDRPVAMAVSGHLVFVAGGDGTAAAYDQSSGTLASTMSCEGGLLSVAVRPDPGPVVLTGPFGAWLWDPTTATRATLTEHTWCSTAAWRDERTVAVATGRAVTVYDRDGTVQLRTSDQASTVTALAWADKGRQLASTAYGGVRLQPARAGAPARDLHHTGSLTGLAVRPAGRWIVAGSQDMTLQVFDLRKDDRLEMSGYPWRPTTLQFDASGRFLANDGAPDITVWDFAQGGPSGRAPIILGAGRTSADRPTAFAWHPTLPVLAVGWDSGRCHVFDVRRGIAGRPMSGELIVDALGSEVAAVCWDAEGSALVLAGSDGLVRCLTVPVAGRR